MMKNVSENDANVPDAYAGFGNVHTLNIGICKETSKLNLLQ